MIYDKIDNLSRYMGRDENLDRVLLDIKNNLRGDLVDENIKKNIFEFKTILSQDKRLENHMKYYDLHLVLEGEEEFELCSTEELENISEKNYDEDVFFGDKEDGLIKGVLRQGYFLVTFVDEAHKLGISKPDGKHVKKIVYKIPVGGKNE